MSREFARFAINQVFEQPYRTEHGTLCIPAQPPSIPSFDRYLGCTLGGAAGDALGYPVEFLSLEDIVAKYGYIGITNMEVDGESGKALISDDTQMTLFTIDGLLTAYSKVQNSQALFHAVLNGTFEKVYLKWLYTQTGFEDALSESDKYDLNNRFDYDMLQPELMNSREPGRTCLNSLMELAKGNQPHNDSKGCGGVMRAAPAGLFSPGNNYEAYRTASVASRCTHKHKTSDEASGALASIISLIIEGKSIRQAVRQTLPILKKGMLTNHETENALLLAIELIDNKVPPHEAISRIGEGWVAEEALAIAVYCALKAKDFRSGVIMAVNHSGDSDSTGAICGNILGALYGVNSIPEKWLSVLELREFITRLTFILHRATYMKAIGYAFYGRKEDFADILLDSGKATMIEVATNNEQ
jgi:ADP-ribosylglycohydrolase